VRGQPQQREAAIGMPRPQPVERGLAAFQDGGEGVGRYAFRPDGSCLGFVDGLRERHGKSPRMTALP
jgi:hypothetical protein